MVTHIHIHGIFNFLMLIPVHLIASQPTFPHGRRCKPDFFAPAEPRKKRVRLIQAPVDHPRWTGTYSQDPMTLVEASGGVLVVHMLGGERWGANHHWWTVVRPVFDNWLLDLAACAMKMGRVAPDTIDLHEVVPMVSNKPCRAFIRDVEANVLDTALLLQRAAEKLLVHPGRRVKRLNPRRRSDAKVDLGHSAAMSYIFCVRKIALVGKEFVCFVVANLYRPRQVKLTTTAQLITAFGGLPELRGGNGGGQGQVELAAVTGVVKEDHPLLAAVSAGKGAVVIVISAPTPTTYLVGVKNTVIQVDRAIINVKRSNVSWRDRRVVVSFQRCQIRCTGGTVNSPVHDALLALKPEALHITNNFDGWKQ